MTTPYAIDGGIILKLTNKPKETPESAQLSTAIHLSKARKKKVLFLSVVIMASILFLIIQTYMGSQVVQVVRMANHKGLGDMVLLTDFEPKQMSREEFEKGASQQMVTAGGSVSTVKSDFILWADRGQYENYFYNYMVNAGQEFLTTTASKDLQFKNPMIEAMEYGQEIYQLPIQPEDIYLQMLYPQTTLKLRVSFEVPTYLMPEITKALDGKTVYDGTSVIQEILIEAGYEVSGTNIEEGEKQFINEMDERTVKVSEIIFNELVAIDMISSSGESIYEIYLSLLNMPIEERIPYLSMSFENDISGQFRQRVTPTALVFDLSEEQATKMYNYEMNDYDIRYTIVKTETTTDMLQGFVEINQQLIEQLKKEAMTDETGKTSS